MSLLFACDRCGTLEAPKYLHGGLCYDCRWGWNAQGEIATTGAAGPQPEKRCTSCGVPHSLLGELCGACNLELAGEMDRLFAETPKRFR